MNLLLNDINQDMATEMILQDQLPLYYLSVFKCPKLVAQKSGNSCMTSLERHGQIRGFQLS